jgi:hypothetical protein
MPTEPLPVTNLPKHARPHPRIRHLTQIVEMLAQRPGVRPELVADIRKQVATGDYATEEKLDLAIYRMLRDVLK